MGTGTPSLVGAVCPLARAAPRVFYGISIGLRQVLTHTACAANKENIPHEEVFRVMQIL